MKNLLFISILSLLPVSAVAAVDTTAIHETVIKQIEEIKPPRQGVSNQAVASVQSPFILFVEKKKGTGTKRRYVQKRSYEGGLKLETVINKVVKINGGWYKEGDKIYGYTIAKVTNDQVLLKSGNIEKKLYLHKADEKIEFKVN